MPTWVYQLTKEQAKQTLTQLNLDATGKLDDLQKQLVQFVRANPTVKITMPNIPGPSTENTVRAGTDTEVTPTLGFLERTKLLNQIRKWGQHFD